ncbi:MAG: nuclear transport factor 2 family protein [Solirubrobacteraceae bacterium]
MRTVTAACTAGSRGKREELAALLSPEIDWRGLAGEDGQTPSCHGRGEALQVIRAGLLANGQMSVSAFVEEGNRVLAHVHSAGDTPEVRERFVVTEVHDGQITHMHGYATEVEARPRWMPARSQTPAAPTSRRCLEAAGVRDRSDELDFEGTLYYRARRTNVDPDATLLT